jgi:D-hexose-6-phosphate mutarotase
MSLLCKNTGSEGFDMEEALHTYFEVGDISTTKIMGLEGTRYLDKTLDKKEERQGREPFALTAETDRIYLGTKSEVVIDDPGLARRIRIEKSGSMATVMWNPWLVKATALPDLGGDAWRRFVCVETCNVLPQAVPVPPGATHTMTTRIRVERTT